MADNITPDEVKRRLIMFLRIPNETWTDVLAMLSRRILNQRIASTCHRLKEISDKNVKCVHVVWYANKLEHNLEKDEPEAKQQLEHLTANKCPLAGQFRLRVPAIGEKTWESIFRHCSDLLRGCRISLDFGHYCQHAVFKQAFLTEMEQLEPVSIKLDLIEPDKHGILRHPTVWKCNRLSLDINQSHKKTKIKSSTLEDIHKWLHRHGQEGEEARCLVLHVAFEGPTHPTINWLLDQCVQDFKQSAKPTDRRKFVLRFTFNYGLDNLANKFDRFENHSTGELLQLQHEGGKFRLRRCLAEEAEGQEEEFYEKLLELDRKQSLNLEEEWKLMTNVWIY